MTTRAWDTRTWDLPSGGSRHDARTRGREDEIKSCREIRRGHALAIRSDARLLLAEIDDEPVLHRKHHIIVEMHIAVAEDVCDYRRIPVSRDVEMDVRRPVRADARTRDEIADRAIERNRVSDRRNRSNDIPAVLV